jgi:hypothetical protein
MTQIRVRNSLPGSRTAGGVDAALLLHLEENFIMGWILFEMESG